MASLFISYLFPVKGNWTGKFNRNKDRFVNHYHLFSNLLVYNMGVKGQDIFLENEPSKKKLIIHTGPSTDCETPKVFCVTLPDGSMHFEPERLNMKLFVE